MKPIGPYRPYVGKRGSYGFGLFPEVPPGISITFFPLLDQSFPTLATPAIQTGFRTTFRRVQAPYFSSFFL